MRPTIAEARSMALQTLIFLSDDDQRMERFLALTGTNPGEIRALAGDDGFLRALLEHVCADEPLLVAFAAAEGADPQSVVAACIALGGTGFE
jgi:hypothetical protein